MPPQYDLFGDTTGLPKTKRSEIPYEIEALSPRESWGAGNGSTSIVCRQTWEDSTDWIRDMVGAVELVKPGQTPLLKRHVPEKADFTDARPHWCSIVEQVEQGGSPGGLLQTPVTRWPRTQWCKYRAVFEVFPYRILTDTEVDEAQAAAGSYPGARELYRYVVRSRRTYSREQPIPAASTAGGFRVIVEPDTNPTSRKPIGQVGFRVICMADVTYKWVRVPINWPPPLEYGGLVAVWPPAANPKSANPTGVQYARDKFIGKINADWFDAGAPDGYAWPPGTLLYTGFDDSNRYDDAAGDYMCDVTYSFKYKEGGWNWFLNAKGEWKEVSLDGSNTGTRPYASAAFDNLFRYAS